PAGWWVTTPQTAGATAATAPTTGSSTVNIGVAPPVVTVSRVSDAAEGGANGKFRFTRTGDTSQDLTVNYTVGGTADLTDFTGPIGSVTIPAGFASADVDVWADDDTDSEPTETVEITLTASSGYALGSSSTAAVNIFDNDAQYVSVSKIADATEGGTAGTFRFTRIGDLSSALVVNYSVGGTAAAGTDFAALGGSAAFAARASTVDVMVSAIDNIRYASSRSVSLTVTSGTGYSVGSSPSTSMSIIEDEGAPVYWIGTDPAGWSIGSNWTSGMVPDASTAVYFDPAYSNYGVTTPALSSDVQLGELHVVNGYGGTITLASDLAVGKLELASAGATIDQPSATYGSDITANGMMVWTGGTINSTTHLANLNITGSTTALFAPTSGGTVSLGSSINLSSGAVATMKEGTINVTNDGTEINVNENCGMMVDPGANKETVVATSPGVTLGDKVRILEGAWVEVRSGTYSNDGWFVNSGGKFTLKADTGAFFSGKGRFGLNEAYDQEDGSTFLYGGSELAVGSQQNVRFQGGTLQTVDAGTTSETWAKIQVGAMGGKLLFAGGDLYINSGPGVTSFGNNYGTLRVVGDVQWGPFGTFHVRVPAESNGTDADLWYATGTFTITSPVALGPQLAPVALSYENDPMTPTTGYTWLILRGDGGITAIQGLTMYDGDLWAHDAVGNPVTQWKLRAK
ncbi:MAG: hypothetical protein J0I06_18075, partial [Planctomycetes bacterium]|nr:hypothetical protein [Planctomycetota bacterium]